MTEPMNPTPEPMEPGVEPEIKVAESQWRRVHPLTPLARSWAILVAVVAIVLSQGNMLPELIATTRDLGWDRQALLVWLLPLILILLVLVVIGLFSYLSWRYTGFAVSQEAVLFRHGIVFKNERHMRLNRVQAVDVVAPLVPRIFGLAKLHVDSAGSSGSQIDIMYLKADEAQALRVEILAKASGKQTAAGPVSAVPGAPQNGTVGTKFISVGEAGLVGALPAAVGESPEVKLYEIPTSMLVGSIVRSVSTWILVSLIPLLLLTAVLPVIVVALEEGQEGLGAAMVMLPQSLLGIGAVVIGLIGGAFRKINEGWNFTALASSDGIRLHHGLTTHDSQTIPPGRVHAVVLKQPILWRKKDWWRVELTMAGYQGGSEGSNQNSKTSSHVLLPVGTRTQALQALWLMERDLGVVKDLNNQEIGTAGTNLLQVMMYGSGPAPGIYTAGAKSRWLDWITWKRKAAVLTTTMVMIRDGRVTRRVSFVPHSRMQSVAFQQGPLERALELANVRLHLVPGVVPTTVPHLPVNSAMRLWEMQYEHADIARSHEAPAAWLERVASAVGGD